METCIFVATHKRIQLEMDNVYKLIQVGTDLSENFGYISDNTGINISSKNKTYCELTALYWIWKNCNIDYVGLCHYRRFFCKKNPVTKKFSILTKKDINKLTEKYDIVIPREADLKMTIYDHYDKNHYIKDLDMCLEAINHLYPDYAQSFDRIVHQNKIRLFNMFIAKKELINQFFEWLFNILKYVEGNIDISTYDTYQKRVFGYLSERLFNVWIYHNSNGLKIKELFVINTEDGKVL